MTNDLVQQLLDEREVERIYLFNNGPLDTYRFSGMEDERTIIVMAEGMNLHKMYNLGVFICNYRSQGAPNNVLICNNDIRLGPRLPGSSGFAGKLASALRSDERHFISCGTLDVDGVPGYSVVRAEAGFQGPAMMLKGEMFPLCTPFDEKYEWWYGETDLLAQWESQGYTAVRADDAYMEHLGGGSQTVLEYAEQVDYWNGTARDTERFYAKWPQIVAPSKVFPL